MPRLLFVVNNPAFFLSHRLPIAREAKAQGFDVHVATPDGPVAKKIAAEFSFHPFYLQRGGRNPLLEARAFLSLARLMRKVRPDIVHAVTIKPVLYAGVLARIFRLEMVSAVSGLGYIFLARGFRAEAQRALVRAAYRVALKNAHAIFQNEDDRALFAHPQSVLIAGSGVDLEAFPFSSAPGEVVMLPSRLLWDKGVGEFVAAARALRGQARFVLVGDTDAANPACVPQTQIEKWVNDGVVEWWGFRQDMPLTLAKAKIVVLPSYREGLPKILLEAAATGRAIVTTDVPGCRDAVIAGKTALLVPARDAQALATAIASLLGSPETRALYGAAGRRLIEAQFSAQSVAAKTVALYKEILA